MNVAAVSTAVVSAARKSTNGSVALRTSSAIRYSGLLIPLPLVTLASSLGLLLPWLLSRMGLDPAFGSGPVATIIQDVLTILVYFQVMTFLLAGAV